jgi:hypothetical protein
MVIAANIDATSSAAEYARYIHQCICSLPSATLLGALTRSEELITIPGLTPTLIKNHLPRSTATDRGHMRRHRSNTASTRNNHSDIVAARAEVDHMFPQHEICTMKDVFCFAALANTITGTMYTNITGAFPVCSFKSMQYIFVAYVYDLNTIIVRAMPSCTDASMVTAFIDVITTLKTGGYRPALNVMDNECSAAVEKYIRSEQINIQLIPPHNHQVNAAERAIATFKEHFIAALATVDMHSPLKLRDEFLPQVELTLNCFTSLDGITTGQPTRKSMAASISTRRRFTSSTLTTTTLSTSSPTTTMTMTLWWPAIAAHIFHHLSYQLVTYPFANLQTVQRAN